MNFVPMSVAVLRLQEASSDDYILLEATVTAVVKSAYILSDCYKLLQVEKPKYPSQLQKGGAMRPKSRVPICQAIC